MFEKRNSTNVPQLNMYELIGAYDPAGRVIKHQGFAVEFANGAVVVQTLTELLTFNSIAEAEDWLTRTFYKKYSTHPVLRPFASFSEHIVNILGYAHTRYDPSALGF